MRFVRGILVAALGLVACNRSAVDPAEDSPRLSSGKLTATVITAEAAPAGVVDVRFDNAGVEQYRFNPCERGVERHEDGGWVALPPELRLCTDEVFALAAGTTSLYQSDVPVGAIAGLYRFVFPVTQEAADGGRELIVSTSFTVR